MYFFVFWAFFSYKTDRMLAILSSKWKWVWWAWLLYNNPFLWQNQYIYTYVWMILTRLFGASHISPGMEDSMANQHIFNLGMYPYLFCFRMSYPPTFYTIIKDSVCFHLFFYFMDYVVLHLLIYHSNNYEISLYL